MALDDVPRLLRHLGVDLTLHGLEGVVLQHVADRLAGTPEAIRELALVEPLGQVGALDGEPLIGHDLRAAPGLATGSLDDAGRCYLHNTMIHREYVAGS